MQYGLVHIAAGDLLRAEVAADTEKGKQAKQYMEKGQLVPDNIVVMVHLVLYLPWYDILQLLLHEISIYFLDGEGSPLTA